MTYIIPNQTTKKITQTNENDLSGNIYVTKNIDLRNNGYIKLSHLPVAIMTEDDDADLTSADAMFKSKDEVFLSSKNVFSGVGGFAKFTDRGGDTEAPTPGVEEDVIFFNGTEVVTDGEYLYYRTATTTWTKTDLDIVGPAQMAVLDSFNVLLIGTSNLVKMVNTAWGLVKTLTLPTDYTITSIETNGSTVYIGTRHEANGEAKLFTWDGSSTAWNAQYGVDSVEIQSIRKYGASCALITNKGQLLQFNGSSFTVLGNLPVFYDKDTVEWGDSVNDHSTVSNRGMYVDKEKIYILLDSRNERGFNINFPSGIWCYTPDNGLNCLNTPSYNRITAKTVADTTVNITDNTITTTNVPITGTPVEYEIISGATIGGINERTGYYTIKVSDTVFKLATTYTNALAGTAIDLTSAGGALHAFYFFPTYDYGQTFINNRGAVTILTDSLNTKSYVTDNLMFTAQLTYPDKVVINQTVPLLPNRGYFITPKLNSSNIEDIYNQVSIKHRPLRTDEKIIVKYRTVEKLDVPFGSFDKGQTLAGTWTDTNTFTTTLDMTNAEVGDEIEIVAGKGAGMLFHIESLSNNAGTWTVNLDETFIHAVANDTMYFYVTNFKKLETITSANTSGIDHLTVSLDKNSKFLQLKVELRGIDVTIEELQVTNKKF